MSNEFKPGDLAWATVHDEHDVKLFRCNGFWVREYREDVSITPADRDVRDLRPAEVLQPGERKVPAGSVVLDPEDVHALGVLAKAFLDDYWDDDAATRISAAQAALRAVAAEQAAPAPTVPPEPDRDALVWADGHAWEWDAAMEYWVRRDSDPEDPWTADWADLAIEDDLEVWHRPDTAPTPSDEWTDGDAVQQINRCDAYPMYAAQRLRGEWYSTVAGEEGSWMRDAELTTWVKRGDLRVLRQQSTGIGCEQ